MGNLHNFAIAVGISLVVSTVVLLVLLQPLKRVLALLCQTGEALPFWRSFTIVRTALVASLFGTIGGLAVIGLKVAGAKPR